LTLLVGIGLLIFTFANAFFFLRSVLNVLGSSDLIKTFGETLAPLMEAAIRVMYLGVMGWVGSILTARGLQIILNLKREEPKASTS